MLWAYRWYQSSRALQPSVTCYLVYRNGACGVSNRCLAFSRLLVRWSFGYRWLYIYMPPGIHLWLRVVALQYPRYRECRLCGRITIMRKIGDVHPVITVLGVIAGLGMFGFIGLVFGPLLVNYIIVLFKIYMNEFVESAKMNNRKK